MTRSRAARATRTNHYARKSSINNQPLDGSRKSSDHFSVFPAKKKKKVDYEALNSALMRIPRMDVAAARNLIDIGIRETFELEGRSPEVLLEDARTKNSSIPDDRIRFFRMAVYYAETENPEPRMLHPDQWT